MGKEKNLTKFKPGQSGNPGGRPRLSGEEKKLMSLTRHEVARLINLTCDMTLDEMKERFDDPSGRAIEKLFIKAVIDGLHGDSIKACEFILNRTVGKPVEETNVSAVVTTTFEKLDGTKIHYTMGPAKNQAEQS